MNYALAILTYTVVYAVLVVVALKHGAAVPFVAVAACSVPVLLVVPRVLHRFTGGGPLLPRTFWEERRLPYAAGWILVFLGNLAFYGDVAVGIYFNAIRGSGELPIGIFAGLAVFLYLVGIVVLEVSFRSWSPRQADQEGGRWQIPVFAVVGLILAGHMLATVFGNFGQR